MNLFVVPLSYSLDNAKLSWYPIHYSDGHNILRLLVYDRYWRVQSNDFAGIHLSGRLMVSGATSNPTGRSRAWWDRCSGRYYRHIYCLSYSFSSDDTRLEKTRSRTHYQFLSLPGCFFNTESMRTMSFQEVEIGLGIFAINPSRTEVVEFTLPMLIASLKVFAGRSSLEVDPWGFLLPLSPFVWGTTVASLLAITGVLLLYSMLLNNGGKTEDGTERTIINTAILLSQCKILTLSFGILQKLKSVIVTLLLPAGLHSVTVLQESTNNKGNNNKFCYFSTHKVKHISVT